jgi:alkylglycerol monooxygenase
MYVSIATAHLVYQFWVHTQHIPKLGFLEWFMVTPSNHRVHHAQNADYIDKNYGGLLIIWDRLFGTFKEEDEHQTPIYGIRTALKSWNPAWANIHVFVNMARDAWHAARWSDKVRVLWARTGWRPADVAARHPVDKANLKNFHKYDPKLSNKANVGIVGQYFLVSFFHLWGAQQAAQLSIELLWATVIAQAYTLIVIGALLEGKQSASFLENTRLIVLSAMLYIGFSAGFLTGDGLYYSAALLLVSAGLMRWCLSVDSSMPSVAGSEPI